MIIYSSVCLSNVSSKMCKWLLTLQSGAHIERSEWGQIGLTSTVNEGPDSQVMKEKALQVQRSHSATVNLTYMLLRKHRNKIFQRIYLKMKLYLKRITTGVVVGGFNITTNLISYLYKCPQINISDRTDTGQG